VARPPPAARQAFGQGGADNEDDGRGTSLKCSCNLTAVERTVAKEGPNKVRPPKVAFRVCARRGGHR